MLSILFTGFPATVACLVLLWSHSYSLDHKLEGTVLLVCVWVGLAVSARDKVVYSLRVVSNLITALKEEDFSFHAITAVQGDALGDLAIEINQLARALEDERLATLEAANLLRKVMTEAGAVVFVFSPDGRIRLVNRAGADYLGLREHHVLNRTAAELNITNLFDGPPSETISRPSSGIQRRWIVRRTHFRQHGVPHRLVILSEASEALRSEERIAWQRIIRVLGHEINNSLAPIRSIAHTLSRMTSARALPPETVDNLRHGLDVIADRADSLSRFLKSYTRLAKLPAPARRATDLRAVIERVARLESRLPVAITASPDACVFVDPDQLEQALINLIQNAVESVLLKGVAAADAVAVSWTVKLTDLHVWILDRGVGLSDTDNLFVPFFTTKEKGSGIGLLLSRQITEAHGGHLRIENRMDGGGCEVEIRIPACVISLDRGEQQDSFQALGSS
ncbi:MAG TPA: ATP-binding protein [Candidatus Limnocylindrales bacterium]|nr:ATP-binding protein [Candidatus Limnocylindrales bacterium]